MVKGVREIVIISGKRGDKRCDCRGQEKIFSINIWGMGCFLDIL